MYVSKHKDKRVEMVSCKCGCGEQLNKHDGNYRIREYLNGHNGRVYQNKETARLEAGRKYYEKTKETHRDGRNEYNKVWKASKRKERKKQMLAYKGDECVNCRLVHKDDNSSIFDFHHLVPSDKKFSVSTESALNLSFEEITKELDKCVIMCANCHRLYHNTSKVNLDEFFPSLKVIQVQNSG